MHLVATTELDERVRQVLLPTRENQFVVRLLVVQRWIKPVWKHGISQFASLKLSRTVGAGVGAGVAIGAGVTVTRVKVGGT